MTPFSAGSPDLELGAQEVLAANSWGTISNVHVSGTINNLIGIPGNQVDYTSASGLVGDNYGTIERSSSTVAITANGGAGHARRRKFSRLAMTARAARRGVTASTR